MDPEIQDTAAVETTPTQQDSEPIFYVWKSLKAKNPSLPEFDVFKNDMQHNEKAFRQVHAVLKTKNKDLPEFDKFTVDMFGSDPFKKKVSTEPSKSGGTVGESETPSTEKLDRSQLADPENTVDVTEYNKPAKDFAASTPSTPETIMADGSTPQPITADNPYKVSITETPVRPSAPILPSDIERMNLNKDADKVKTAMKYDEKAGPFRDADYTQKKFDEFKAQGFSDEAIEQGMADADKSYIDKSQAEAIPIVHEKELAEAKQRLIQQGFKDKPTEGGGALEEAVAEVVQNTRDQYAVGRLSPDDRAIYELNTQIDAISQKPKQSPKERIELANLKEQASALKANGSKYLYDPITGQMVGKDQASKEAIQYSEGVDKLAEQYTYKQNLDQLRNEAYDKVKYFDNLLETSKKVQGDISQRMFSGYDQSQHDEMTAAQSREENLKNMRIDALMKYDALNKAIMLNENPGTIREGGLQQFKDRFTHALAKEIPFFEGDNSGDLTTKDYYEGTRELLTAKSADMVPKEMKEAYKDSFAGELGSATGGIVGIMPKLMAFEIATGGVANYVKLPQAIAALKRSASALDKMTAFVIESGIESAKFAAVGIDPKAAPGFVLPGYLGKYRFSVNPKGKIGAIIAPFVASSLEKGLYGTVAMEAGGVTESIGHALSTNRDISTEIEKTFGSGLDDFTKKVIIDFAANTLVAMPGGLKNVATSPFSKPEALRKAANNLDEHSQAIFQEYKTKRDDNNGEMPTAEAKEYATRIYDNTRSADEMRKRADALEKSVFGKKKVDNSYEDVTGEGEAPAPEAAPSGNGKPKSPPPSSPAGEAIKWEVDFYNDPSNNVHDWQKERSKEQLDLLKSDPIAFFEQKRDEKTLNGEEYFYGEARRQEFQQVIDELKAKQKPLTDEEVNAAADELKVSEEDTGERSGEEEIKVGDTVTDKEGVTYEVLELTTSRKGVPQAVVKLPKLTDEEVKAKARFTVFGRNENRLIYKSENDPLFIKEQSIPISQEVSDIQAINGGNASMSLDLSELKSTKQTAKPEAATEGEQAPSDIAPHPKGKKVFTIDKNDNIIPATVVGYTPANTTLLADGKTGGGFVRVNSEVFESEDDAKAYIDKTKEPAPSEGSKPVSVRDLATMQDGEASAAVFSQLKKDDVFKVGSKTYTVTSVSKDKRNTFTDKKGKERYYDVVTYRIKDDKGKTITTQLWKWDNGNSQFTGVNSNNNHEQLSRDIEGDINVDLINENNKFHEPSDSFRLAQQYVGNINESEQNGKQREQLLLDLEAAIKRTAENGDSEANKSLQEKYDAIKAGSDFSVTDVTKDLIRANGAQFGEMQNREAMKDNYQRQLEKWEKNPTEAIKNKIIELEKKLGYETSYFDLNKLENETEPDTKDVKVPDTKSGEPKPVKPKAEPKPKKSVIDDDQELKDLFKEFNDEGGFNTNAFIGATNPKLIAVILKIMKRFIELGIHKLEDIIRQIHQKYGEPFLREAWDYIKNAYTSAYNESPKDVRALMDKQDHVLDFDLDKFIADIKAEESKAEEDARKTPENFVSKIKEDIRDGVVHNKASLEKLGREYGLTDATKIKELAELAVVERAKEIINQPNVPEAEKLDQIIDLYNTQPNLTHRSSNSIELQQYSTPAPYSYAAGLWVGLDKGATAFEPTAGNGMLTIASSNPNVIVVNEIDPDRLESLHKQGFKVVIDRDASTAKPFPELDKTKQAVLANPPFGKLDEPTTKDGFIIRKLEHQIIANTLDAMKDDAKASFIVGGHNEYDEKGRLRVDLPFYNWLYSHYNVKDVINVDGDLYKKQGTTFPTRLILIDGRKSVVEGQAPANSAEKNVPVKTWEELYNRVKRAQNSVSYENILQPGVDAGSEPSGDLRGGSSDTDISGSDNPVPSGQSGGSGGKGGSRRGGSRGSSPRLPGQQPSTEPAGSEGDSAGDNGNGPDAVGDKPTTKPSGGKPETGNGPDESTGSKNTVRGDDILENARKLAGEAIGSKDNKKVPYTPFSKNYSVQTVMPQAMVYQTARTLHKIEAEHGDIDQWVADELGYKDQQELFTKLSGEQIDGVAIAINQIKKGQASIIGDQTGVGKGRVAAALIRYGIKNGLKTVFITKKDTLFSDIYRDLIGIGSGDVKPFIVNGDVDVKIKDDKTGKLKILHKGGTNKSKEGSINSKTIPKDSSFVMATYSQFSAAEKDKKGNVLPPDPKKEFLKSFSSDALVIMDESHSAGGKSNTGKFFQGIVSGAKGATFLSATFAKRAENMPLYVIKSVMKEAGLDNDKLIGIIESGGVALQEIVANELVAAGQMIRRERTFEGIDFNYHELTHLEKGHAASADKINEIARRIIRFQQLFVEGKIGELDDIASTQGGGKAGQHGSQKDAGVNNTPFASKIFNLIDQFLFSVKAEAVADQAIEMLKNNEKPLISFKSTMEAFISDMDINAGEILHTTDFSASLLKGLQNTLNYIETLPTGDTVKKAIPIETLGEEAVKDFKDIVSLIEKASSGLSISPIDVIINKIEKAGYTVGEVTGRSLQFKEQEDGTLIAVRKKDTDFNEIFNGFNNINSATGKPTYDVLMFNESGSTGVSAHASVDFSDQRVRHMIIHQVHLNIDTLMQALGRILRTGQVVNPKYTFTSSAIPAEMRMMMMMMKKLKSLSANTTSSQKSNDEMFSQEDFLNEYGDDIVLQMLIENPDLNKMLMDPLDLESKGPDELSVMSAPKNAASKVTSKVAIMPVSVQREFYKEVVDRYNDYVQYLKDTDSYSLEADDMPLDAETLASQVIIEGHGGVSAFGNDSVLEKVDVNILKKPYTKAQIELQLKEQLDGETPDAQMIRIKDEVLSAIEKKYEESVAAAQAKTNEFVEKMHKQIEAEIAAERAAIARGEEIDPESFKSSQAEIEQWINDGSIALTHKLGALKYHHEANKTYLTKVLSEFRPGKIVMVPLSEKNLMLGAAPGVVIGFHINKKSSNPYAPSAIKIKIAIGDSRQSMSIPLSRQAMIGGIISSTYMNNTSQSLLEHWDSTRPQKARGTRYIITGNVLQALGKPEYNGGKLISYTKKDGTPQKGILLPEYFATNVDTKNPTVVKPLISMLPKIKALGKNEFIVTSDGKVKVSRDLGRYKISVPRSKKEGGDIYLDPEIRKLIEYGNFDSYGDRMVAFVESENIDPLIRLLQDKYKLTVTVPNEKSIDQQIRDQQQRVRDAENDNLGSGGSPTSMNPIPTKKQAKLMYEYGKLAWLYLKKGMSSVADFLRIVGEKFSEMAVKAWNATKEQFEKDRIVERLDRAKITGKTFSIMPPFNLFPAVWNGSIDVIKRTILASGRTATDIDRAVEDGLAHAKSELAAAGGPVMSPAEEAAYKNKMKDAFSRLAPTPSFGNPANPPTADEIKLSREKVKQALNPEEKKPGTLGKVKDFFTNLSKHIDNPFIYVTNIESDVLKQYPNADRTSNVPLGRLFEQSFTGPAKLAVEKYRDEVLSGLSPQELESFHELLFATRVIDRLTTDPQARQTGNVTMQDAVNTINDIEQKLGPASYAKLVDRGERFQEHMDAALRELVDGGIISQETYDAIKKSNEFYAPFNVVQTAFSQAAKETDGAGSTVLFKIKGIAQEKAKLTLLDLNKLQQAVDDKIITPDEFYRGAMEILDELRKSGRITEEKYMEEVARLANPGFQLTNIFDKAAEIIYKSMVIAERNKIMLKLDQMREVDADQHFLKNVDGYEFRNDPSGAGYMVPKQLNQIKAPEGFGVVKYKKDGKTMFVAVNEEAAKAIRGLNEFEMTGVMHLMNIANKIARYGIITYSASFLYANSFIDNYRALTMSKYGAIAGKNIMDTALNTLVLVPQMVEALYGGLAANLAGHRTPSYESWMRSKSFKKGIFDDIFDDPKHKITAEINKTPGDKVMAALRYALTLIPRIGTALEQMPKLYIHARGQDIEGVERLGLTKFIKGKLDAAQGLQGAALGAALEEIAYDVLNKAGSPNFSATGNWAKYMSGLFQFFGARLKGEFTDWRVITNTEGGGIDKRFTAKNVAMGVFKLGMYAILPMLYAAIKNIWDDDDEKAYNTVSDYDKNNNIMIKSGAEFNVDGERYLDYVKLPVRGVPATANTLVNSLTNYYKHQNPEALKNIALQLYTNATPLNLNIDFKEGEPGAERTRKVIQSVVSNMNPLIKYGYEELNNVNSFNSYPLIKETGRQGAMYRQYLKGNENVKPWDIQPYHENEKATEVSKYLYDKFGIQVTAAGVDHFMKVPMGNIFNALDTNALSKRIFRSEEENPVKRK